MDSGVTLFAGYVFIVAICWSERTVTYFHEKYQSRHTDWKSIGLRTLLYGIATTLRLWYMLIAMYFNIGFFIVVIFGLTSAQLVVEYLKATRRAAPIYSAQEGGDHRHNGSSGYTSLEYKDQGIRDIGGGSSDSEGKRRSRHVEEEEQRLFSGPSDHEEYELTRNAESHGRVSETAF